MKVALGTAQFGTNYGIANVLGQINILEAKAILNYAAYSGIDTIDTAIAYGESEKCLGEIGLNNYRIITKLPEIPDGYIDLKDWVFEQVQNSLDNLKVKSLSGLLLHRPSQLLDPDKKNLWSILVNLKNTGQIEKLGFSIYTPDELSSLWNLFKPDIVQAPYNILDRRLEMSGWLQRLYDENVEIHIRSIFL